MHYPVIVELMLTLSGQLWMSLGYDQNGFEHGAIEGFWQEVQDVAREVLL